MVDRFFATTEIKHGAREEDGSQDGKYTRTVIKPNQEVKGLSKEDMQSLWDAGALERRGSGDDEPAESESSDQKQTSSPAPAKTSAKPAQGQAKS
jgi:hypothetical protein